MEVFVLEVKFTFNDRDDSLYPVILKNENEMILVDGGYAGFLPLLEEAAAVHNLSLANLTGLLLTHHDIDHIGVACEIRLKYPAVKIFSSLKEEGYISGKQKSLRLEQAEALYQSLADDQKPAALSFQRLLKTVQPISVDHILPEGGMFINGVEIIDTPGHMPGHVSLYVRNQKTLIAADALVIQNGELDIANPHFTLDLPEAINSVQKLYVRDIKKIICYHGGIMEEGIKLKIGTVLSRYN
jgi:glyoxylase-like metal-dependent hydrolase (beta-lactamase superfamily II)